MKRIGSLRLRCENFGGDDAVIEFTEKNFWGQKSIEIKYLIHIIRNVSILLEKEKEEEGKEKF